MRLKSLEFPSLRLSDPFWLRWQRAVREVSLPHQYDQIVQTGRLANFQRAAKGETGTHQGYYYNDSDVYKWLEACAYALATQEHAPLRKMAEEVLGAIQAAQMPDGYLNTYFQLMHPSLRLRNLVAMHELYCAGHLIECGVAWKEALNDDRMLTVALRLADHIASIFGPDKRPGYCGHQELELALVRLAKATGNAKYAELARWMVESRGTRPSPLEACFDDSEAIAISPWMSRHTNEQGVYTGEYLQDHAPIREQTTVVGHAVRAMYLNIAAVELLEDDDALAAMRTAWDGLSGKRMYVTGGIGPSAHNEGFTVDYDLPNLTSYAETCAACGLAWWGRKMRERTGEAEYMDVVERALYNGVLSGISLKGDRFFYANPLESRGRHDRVPWFDCACCPPNVARLIASVDRFVAAVDADTFHLDLPVSCEADVVLGGTKVRIEVASRYPWAGVVEVRVFPEEPAEFGLAIRLPDWAEDTALEVKDDEDSAADYENGYAVVRRRWTAGDEVTIQFEMPAAWVEAHPKVLDNLGRVALTRGPLVYCLEEKDAGFTPQSFAADVEAEVLEGWSEDLGGHVRLTASGWRESEDFPDGLYAAEGTTGIEEASAAFVPYHAWCNRGPNSMQVWVRRG